MTCRRTHFWRTTTINRTLLLGKRKAKLFWTLLNVGRLIAHKCVRKSYSGCDGDLSHTGDVIHSELLHHGLAIAAYGFEPPYGPENGSA
jgi:hypothetical protein